jgi:hypothetical protein
VPALALYRKRHFSFEIAEDDDDHVDPGDEDWNGDHVKTKSKRKSGIRVGLNEKKKKRIGISNFTI